jgi:hypothetical protein
LAADTVLAQAAPESFARADGVADLASVQEILKPRTAGSAAPPGSRGI